jgi:folylpolyglutamate synthase/dihydropteroate synthase
MGSEKVGAAARAVLGRGSKSGGDEDVAEWAFGRDVVGGLKRASEIADEGPLVVAGSLYLVGSVLRALRESQEGI